MRWLVLTTYNITKDRMENLYKETLEVLISNWKTEKDVEYILWYTEFSTYSDWDEVYNTWKWFKSNADFNYDNGYGGHNVQGEIKVVWKDFWLERWEYDWSEWWEFKEFPTKPEMKWNIEIQEPPYEF